MSPGITIVWFRISVILDPFHGRFCQNTVDENGKNYHESYKGKDLPGPFEIGMMQGEHEIVYRTDTHDPKKRDQDLLSDGYPLIDHTNQSGYWPYQEQEYQGDRDHVPSEIIQKITGLVYPQNDEYPVLGTSLTLLHLLSQHRTSVTKEVRETPLSTIIPPHENPFSILWRCKQLVYTRRSERKL